MILFPLQFCLQNTHKVTQTLALPLSFLRTAFAHEGFQSGLVSVHFASSTVTGITAFSQSTLWTELWSVDYVERLNRIKFKFAIR